MHYYKRNIGDYAKKAGRLSMLQHGAYTLLLDACYDREQFPTIDDAIAWTWASSDEEIAAVKFVLSRFFVLEDGVYVQNRIKDEFESYRQKSKKNQEIALAREEAKRVKVSRNVHDSSPEVHELAPNQEPITNNQEYKTSCDSGESPRRKSAPVAKLIELYNQRLGGLLPTVQVQTPKRKSAATARWHEIINTTNPHGNVRYHDEQSGLEWWSSFFAKVKLNPHWIGENDRGWKADFDWIMNPNNFTKILEYVPTNRG